MLLLFCRRSGTSETFIHFPGLFNRLNSFVAALLLQFCYSLSYLYFVGGGGEEGTLDTWLKWDYINLRAQSYLTSLVIYMQLYQRGMHSETIPMGHALFLCSLTFGLHCNCISAGALARIGPQIWSQWRPIWRWLQSIPNGKSLCLASTKKTAFTLCQAIGPSIPALSTLSYGRNYPKPQAESFQALLPADAL